MKIVADRETCEILREEAGKGAFSGVIHCFSVGREVAETALDLGFYISLSGIVTFKNAAVIQDVASKIPLNRMLIETDAPYLAPVPYRGKTNEPAYVAKTGEFLADFYGLSVEEFAKITTENFYRLFNKAKSA